MRRERFALVLMLLLAGLGCSASKSALREGEEATRRGRLDEAVLLFERALAERPGDVEVRIALIHARSRAAHLHLDAARKHLSAGAPERAAAELERALELDPTNRYASETLDELRGRFLAGAPPPEMPPGSGRLETPVSLEFEDESLRHVLETLADLAGANLLFDEAYRDRQVTVKLSGVTFIEALELLTRTHGLFYVLESSRAVTVGTDAAR